MKPCGRGSIPYDYSQPATTRGYRMKNMPDRPDTWAAMIAWLANHRNEAGYSILAFVMSILATSRNKKTVWRDRMTGAVMCGILCFFAQPTLTALCAILGWTFPPELCWPFSAFVGYIGVDALFSSVRKRVGMEGSDGGANADS